MKFSVKVENTKYNELLKRKEVFFVVSHEGGPTPSRFEVREKLAGIFGVDVDRVYIVRMETITGNMTARGEAHIYDSHEQAKLIEQKHIILRNIPKKEKESEK